MSLIECFTGLFCFLSELPIDAIDVHTSNSKGEKSVLFETRNLGVRAYLRGDVKDYEPKSPKVIDCWDRISDYILFSFFPALIDSNLGSGKYTGQQIESSWKSFEQLLLNHNFWHTMQNQSLFAILSPFTKLRSFVCSIVNCQLDCGKNQAGNKLEKRNQMKVTHNLCHKQTGLCLAFLHWYIKLAVYGLMEKIGFIQ